MEQRIRNIFLLFFHGNKITSTYSEAYLLPAISREYNVKQKVSIKKSKIILQYAR